MYFLFNGLKIAINAAERSVQAYKMSEWDFWSRCGLFIHLQLHALTYMLVCQDLYASIFICLCCLGGWTCYDLRTDHCIIHRSPKTVEGCIERVCNKHPLTAWTCSNHVSACPCVNHRISPSSSGAARSKLQPWSTAAIFQAMITCSFFCEESGQVVACIFIINSDTFLVKYNPGSGNK